MVFRVVVVVVLVAVVVVEVVLVAVVVVEVVGWVVLAVLATIGGMRNVYAETAQVVRHP